jgi:hypothetical protein
MRCAALGCTVQTFREQVPGVLDRYQRRTTRLAGQVSAVVRELPVLAVTTAREAGLPHLRSFTRDPAAPPHPAQLTLRSVTTENALAAACRVSAVAQPVSAAARLARTLTSP